MKIEILGMSCPKCRELYENTCKALEGENADVEIIKIEDMSKITEYGVVMTPALAVDGNVKCAGTVPSPDEIEKWIA